MQSFNSDVSLFLAGILAAFAILGLIILVPGLLTGPITLSLIGIGIVVVIIVVVLFALTIIIKGLAQLLKGLKN